LGGDIGFVDVPQLFLRTFVKPEGIGQPTSIKLRHIVDDGLILYLNGQEIFRTPNMVGVPPFSYTARTTGAGATIEGATCVTNDISGAAILMHPRTNWLAAAVYQSTTDQSDVVFGLEMDMTSHKLGIAPTNFPPGIPTLTRTLLNRTNFVLSWPATNYGYELRYSTNIIGRTAAEVRNWGTNDAYWLQVKDQSNPYTNRIPPTTGPRRFYRLFKERLN
jgi:hypothetical protein